MPVPYNVNLYLTSDWHCGAETCDYDALRALIRDVKSDPQARIILGGDQMEMTPPGHHDGLRHSDSDLDHQIIRTIAALKDISNKILIIYQGNHGAKRFEALDPDLILASVLKVPYSTVPTVVRLVFKDERSLKICGGHGKSGGKNSDLELEKLTEIYTNCDVYHLGHNHDLYAKEIGSLEYDDEGKERWVNKWICRTGSMLLYAAYSRYAVMKPRPTGYLIVKIRKGSIRSIEAVKS